MENFTPISAITGGSLIGFSAALMYTLHGRITGISGIVSNLFSASLHANMWRILFIVGILAGAVIGQKTQVSVPTLNITSQPYLLIAGGLLVGLGTTIGSGCTSGHGVCGVARLSMRSMVATALFMITAFVVVKLHLHGV